MDDDQSINDPNVIEVINDVQPIEKSNDSPVIPTAEELAPPPPPPQPNPDAPYGYNKDGTPAKKRGRKSASESAQTALPDLDSVTPAKPRPQQAPSAPKAATIAVNYRALGQQAANLWFNLPQIFLGQEWAPEKEEVPIVADAFKDYFEANGIASFSPGFQLTLVLGSYSLSKAAKPSIRERLSSIASKFKVKLPWKK